MTNRKQLIEKFAHIVYNALNEARILRTIDPKIWATVSSVICKKYKNDFGASAKARSTDTKEILLQKYVAALIILKQPCPTTGMAMESGKVFPLWAKALISQGVTVAQVIDLYNQNTNVRIPVPVQNAVDNAIDDTPVAVPVKKEPVVKQKHVVQQLANKTVLFTADIKLRTLIPSTSGGGHEDKDYAFIELTDNDNINNIKEAAEHIGETYNTFPYKNKCRDGWYSTYFWITIKEIAHPELKATIEITREYPNPRIAYYINDTYKFKPTLEDLYGNNVTKQPKKIETTAEVPSKRWKIVYDDGDDISNVWVEALTKEEAISKVRREYHDCKEIISIKLMKS